MGAGTPRKRRPRFAFLTHLAAGRLSLPKISSGQGRAAEIWWLKKTDSPATAAAFADGGTAENGKPKV